MMRSLTRLLASLVVVAVSAVAFPTTAAAQSFQRISGEGSSWAAGAIDAMRVNVRQFGITVDYNPSGSTAGRKNFLNGTVDFAGSDIPFQFSPEDGSEPEKPAEGSYAYMPITAGGTSFMYNLKINGQRVTNLRLSGENVAKIFAGVLTRWDDPALAADNPGLSLPNRKIVPVVRSDGSGSTGQFSRWMIKEHGGIWNDYCKRSGRAPKCGETSFYPTVPGMIGQSGDLGVAGYVGQSQAEGAIGYVNYSYSLSPPFPVAKVLNRAGYYTEPTPDNVAVSLLKAQINTDAGSRDYLTQQLDGVYADADERNYPLSSYSYLILPAKLPEPGKGQFNLVKGKTLSAFSYYAMCQAQEQSASLGYSPMPINLVQASFDQIRKIPGAVVQDIDVSKCKNPTFSPDGTNVLVKNAKKPAECDKKGPAQCATGTGGVKGVPTAVNGASAAAGGPGAAGQSGGGQAGPGGTGTGPATGSAGGSGPVVCDADGNCAPSSGSTADATAGGPSGDEQAISKTTTLAGRTGWSGAQTLLALVVLLTLALVLAPAVAWRALSERPPR